MTAGSTADREIVHSRVIDAPPGQVFAAIADPARLARWWGPDGFTSSFDVFEFRPGGRWHFTLHGPDGSDYANENVFATIAPDRIVVEHLGGFHHFVLTITLSPHGDRVTRVGWHQVFDTAAHTREIEALVRPATEQNLDRLAAEVARG